MRRIGGIVAILLILGLAAVGLIYAQKNIAASSSAVASGSTAASDSLAAAAVSHRSPLNPVSERSRPAADAPTHSAEPTRMAEATTAAPAVPNAPAPNASAQHKPMAIPPCDTPGALGLARIVEIDPTGGFGFEHFKQYDFLRDKEVVLTFDDGPWPGNTPAVLKALADECLKATFFEIGEHATWHPEITKQVIEAGMTVGTHTWSHKDLARNPYVKDVELAKQEIEMGISAVHIAAGGGKVAPFFRFPDLQHPPQLMSYLAERNIAVFSTDINSRDFKMRKPEEGLNR